MSEHEMELASYTNGYKRLSHNLIVAFGYCGYYGQSKHGYEEPYVGIFNILLFYVIVWHKKY